MRAAAAGACGVEKLQGRPPSVGEFSHRGQFEILKELQSNGTGSVHLARIKDQRTRLKEDLIVLKQRKVPELGKAKDMLNEYEVLKGLNHPNVIRCHGYFWEFQSQSLFIVLEYANRGDLHSELQNRKRLGKQFADDEVWDILAQVLLGLSHIHAKGIVHRDIKSLNLLLTDAGAVKLGDFGVSRQMSDKTMFLNSFYGTPLYLSPELIEGRPYSRTTDIWSLGVVLYELLSLQPPFKGPSLQDVIAAVLRCQYAPLPRTRPQEFHQVVSKMLAREASNRPSAEGLLRLLDSMGKLRRVSASNQQRVPPRRHEIQQEIAFEDCGGLSQPTSAPRDKENRSPPASSSGSSSSQAAAALAAAGQQGEELGAEPGEGPQVVRVRRRRPSSAGAQASAPEAPQPAPPVGQGKSLFSAPTPGQPSEAIGAPPAAVPKSMRDARWEARRHAHVLRVTRVNREDLLPAGRREAWGAGPEDSASPRGSGGDSGGGASGSGGSRDRPSSQTPDRSGARGGGSSGSSSGAAGGGRPPLLHPGATGMPGRVAGARPPAPPVAQPQRVSPQAPSFAAQVPTAAGGAVRRAASEDPMQAHQRRGGRGGDGGGGGRQAPRSRYDIISNRWIEG